MNDHRFMLQTMRSAAIAAAGVLFLTFFGGVIVASAQAPDAVAMLEQAKREKVELSREEKKMANKGTFSSDWRRDLKYCNTNDFDNRHSVSDTSRFCGLLGDHLKGSIGVTSRATELAYLRSCAFVSHYGNDHPCADLGSFYVGRGDYGAAMAVYLHAPNCDQPEPTVYARQACLDGAYGVSVKVDDKHLQAVISKQLCDRFSDPYACGRLNEEFGGSVDVAAAQKRYSAIREKDARDIDAGFAADEQERLERQQARDDKWNAAISSLRSMPGASDPNAILNAANQQGAQMVAIGAANDAARRDAAQARLQQQQAAQAQLAVQQSSARPAAEASASGNASSINGFGATGNSASSATTTANYAAPLSASCIRQFWDPNNYNWLSFQNTCSQAVRVDFIASNPDDTFGMSSKDLAPGQADSTGWSQTDVSKKRGFALFVCPAGYLAVDSTTDQPVRHANENFRCKQQ